MFLVTDPKTSCVINTFSRQVSCHTQAMALSPLGTNDGAYETCLEDASHIASTGTYVHSERPAGAKFPQYRKLKASTRACLPRPRGLWCGHQPCLGLSGEQAAKTAPPRVIGSLTTENLFYPACGIPQYRKIAIWDDGFIQDQEHWADSDDGRRG